MRLMSSLTADLAQPLSQATPAKAVPRKCAMPERHDHCVMHFIPSLGGGGAEAMLGNLVESMKSSPWRTIIVVLDGQAWPEAVQRLQACGAEVHDLESSAFLRPWTLLRLIRLMRRIKPDVVQTWMHHADFVGGWCARLAGVHHVIWGVHCREIHRNPGEGDAKAALFRKLIAWSATCVPTRIVSCSAAAMEDHAKLGYPRRKLVWVPNGIDTKRFMPDAADRLSMRREFRLPTEAPVVGFMGRFHEMKDLSTWLRAAALLQARRPEVHFLLCGGGEFDLGDCARAALSVVPRRQQVHFAPFRADPENVYIALDVFSLSSRTEACPMTLMEALSCGVRCVATDVGDCARLLEGVGKVVPPRDPEALALAWEEMLFEKAPDRAALHKAAIERFDIAVAAGRYEAVYEEVTHG